VRARAPIVHHERPGIARCENRGRESAGAIRAKNWFWRAPMTREAAERENFFIAKKRDSESTQRTFDRLKRSAMTSLDVDRKM
jgi:hypothetical protein